VRKSYTSLLISWEVLRVGTGKKRIVTLRGRELMSKVEAVQWPLYCEGFPH